MEIAAVEAGVSAEQAAVRLAAERSAAGLSSKSSAKKGSGSCWTFQPRSARTEERRGTDDPREEYAQTHAGAGAAGGGPGLAAGSDAASAAAGAGGRDGG